jgi:hypothetical protein
MRSKSDFWLTLHKLAHDLCQEGETEEQRIESVYAVLDSMSVATKQVYCDDLKETLSALSGLAMHCKTHD